MSANIATNIRACTLADIDSISDWLDTTSNSPWSVKAITEVLEKPHYRVLVSHSESVVSGLCLFTLVADECNLLYIAVGDQYRQQGIGRQLLNTLITQSRQHDISRVFLEVRESNQAAIALYIAAGFVNNGMRKNYYPAIKAVLVSQLDSQLNSQIGSQLDSQLDNETSQRETALLFDLSLIEINKEAN
jgi:ribosomal-protein-alanine acetyltransferase